MYDIHKIIQKYSNCHKIDLVKIFSFMKKYRSDFHWQMLSQSSWEKQKEFDKRISEIDAAVEFYNGLSEEQQKLVDLIAQYSYDDGYDSGLSQCGEGP